jgi:hypothetical protein
MSPDHPRDPIDRGVESAQVPGGENEPSIPEARRHQQRAFEHAAQAVAGGTGQSPSDPASLGIEIRNLEEWARREGALIAESEVDSLDQVSNSTSEHEVFYRSLDARAVKRTWAGVYGQIPAPGEGRLERRNATPSEYLSRMALQIAVFGSDLQLEGVTISEKPSMIIGQPSRQPSMVISQQWYERDGIATTEAIHDFLVEEGFRAVPSSYFGWYRFSDRVVIVDAKPDNFIKTSAGLIPIDLQMAQFSAEQMKTAGLISDASAPIIFIPR